MRILKLLGVLLLIGVIGNIAISIFGSDVDAEPKLDAATDKTPEKIEKSDLDAANAEVIQKAQKEHELRSITTPMTINAYPQLYKDWGTDRMNQINELLYPIAYEASLKSDCGNVEYIGLSNTKGVSENDPTFFVECSSGARYWLSESEYRSGKTLTKGS